MCFAILLSLFFDSRQPLRWLSSERLRGLVVNRVKSKWSKIGICLKFRPLSHERHESYDFNFCHVILSATAFHTSDSNRTTLFHNGSGRSGCCVSAGRFTKECYVIR